MAVRKKKQDKLKYASMNVYGLRPSCSCTFLMNKIIVWYRGRKTQRENKQ